MVRINYSDPYRVFRERGKASDYIQTWDTVKPGDSVVLCARKSFADKNDSLDDQEANLRREALAAGAKVVGIVRYEGSGRHPDWLCKAVVVAKKHNAKLVAESTSRFRRNDFYSNRHQEAQARTCELEDLRYWTEGLPLVTHLHPDASPSEERSYQTRRRSNRKRGGRPSKPGYKKRRRARLKSKALAMRAAGKSLGEIAKQLGCPRSTIQGWMWDG
jgi:hypothetical protein